MPKAHVRKVINVRSAMYQVPNLSLLSLSDSPSKINRSLRELEMALVVEAGEVGVCRIKEVVGALAFQVADLAILARSAKSSQIALSSTLGQELEVNSNHNWGCLRSITTIMLSEAPTATKLPPCYHPSAANRDNSRLATTRNNNELKHAQTLQDHL